MEACYTNILERTLHIVMSLCLKHSVFKTKTTLTKLFITNTCLATLCAYIICALLYPTITTTPSAVISPHIFINYILPKHKTFVNTKSLCMLSLVCFIYRHTHRTFSTHLLFFIFFTFSFQNPSNSKQNRSHKSTATFDSRLHPGIHWVESCIKTL